MADLPDTPQPEATTSAATENETNLTSLLIITRLEKNLDNDNFITRQQEARNILETLKAVWPNLDDVNSVMAVMGRLIHDPETNVRVELINQIPHVAVFCHQRENILGPLIRQHLIPLLVNVFSDDLPSVRKSSHNAFLLLLEQGLVHKTMLEEWLCPMVAMQAGEETIEEDRRLEALLLLCKVASLVGPDLTEKFFLSQFLRLCSHPSPAMRKACAIKMAEMCNVMGTALVESHLLPKFLELCRDNEWEIRRCCAEDFMEISWVCQLSTRHHTLAPLFLELLSDTDYVKSAAYQSLGPFISTFVDPLSFSPPPLPPSEEGDHSLMELQKLQELCAEVTQAQQSSNMNQLPDEAFNTFQYWREPLPEVDPSMLVGGKPNVCIVRPMRKSSPREVREAMELITRLEDFSLTPTIGYHHMNPVELSDKLLPYFEELGKIINDGDLGRSPTQGVVPRQLLEHYISMAGEAGGLSGQCAYGLPAVALTLRQEGWACLRVTWLTLVEDVQWRVRRSLAASIHHLAVILGPALASTDLMPAFWVFLNDLDEVRSALLGHLHHFLRALSPEDRHTVLTHLSIFLRMENRNNWRYRMALAHQLQNVAELYPCQEVLDFIIPIGLALLKDRVFTVRQTATKLIALQLCRFRNQPNFVATVLQQLAEVLYSSPKWTRRQMYVFLCEEFVEERALPIERFASQVAPLLLRLAWDPVANVRLAVARVLSRNITASYLQAIKRHNTALLTSCLTHLRGDKDRDVLHFIQLCPFNL